MSNATAQDDIAIDGFENIEALAITKSIATKIVKTARNGLETGVHSVSFDVHIEGTVTVGEDYETRMVNKAKPWNLVYVLLEEVNKLRSASGQAGIDINKLMAMAETIDPNLVKAAKKKAEVEAAAIKAATLGTAKGKVTTDLTVSAVS
jgi:hypothetical protein